MSAAQHVVVVSHPRSGTHLTIDSIANNFEEWRRPYLNLDRIRPDHENPISVKEAAEQLAQGPHVIKTHTRRDIKAFFLGQVEQVDFVERLLDDATTFYVHRDGRDVMVSLYYYVQTYRPELVGVSFSDFLRSPNDQDTQTYEGELSRPEYWNDHVMGWIGDDLAKPLPFELLRSDYSGGLRYIAEALNRNPPERPAPVIRAQAVDVRTPLGVWKDRLHKLALRFGYGVRSTAVNFRSGRTGDYRTHFGESDRAYFNERAGHALRHLGYEQ